MTKNTKNLVLTKKHLARVERERIQTRWILISTIIVITLVVGLIGFGILNEWVLKPNAAIVTVNSDKGSLQRFQEEARYARLNLINQYQQTQQMAQYFGSDPTTQQYFTSQLSQIASQLETSALGQSVLNNMIADLLIRQEAKKRNITVTQEEVDAYIQEQFGFYKNGTPTAVPTIPVLPTSTLSPLQMTLVPPTATPVVTQTATATPTLAPTQVITITPTAAPSPTPFTEEGYNKSYDEYIAGVKDSANVSEATLRYIFESNLYRTKVQKAILDELNLAQTQEEVWARHILVDDEVKAKEVSDRLNAGEDFAVVAAALSSDSSASQGGDLGWFAKGKMVAEFETAAFSMEIGEISQPVKSQFGYHIIQVLGHEDRPISEADFSSLQATKFQEWIDSQQQAAVVVINDSWITNVPTEPALPSN